MRAPADSTPTMEIQALPLWEKLKSKRAPISFELEMTARCNNACRHCYINLPAGDRAAQEAELSADEIIHLGKEAVELGAVWCLLTGGEPFLRTDFQEIFLGLKRLGLLVSVFTNACLLTPAHVELFRAHPPRDIEVTVYGASRATYEAVTRKPGSWDAFMRGLDLLRGEGIAPRLKAMVLRSNVHELAEISEFCRERTKDYYRFDPFLHLRLDGDPARNEEIKAERLTPQEIVAVEQADKDRFEALRRGCADGTPVGTEAGLESDESLFVCNVGSCSFAVGHDGMFRLCNSLCHPDTVYDLRRGTLREAWQEWVPQVLALPGSAQNLSARCRRCALVDLCMWCPANAALETGDLEGWVEYFCEVAHARAAALRAGGEVS